ncbi:hypothetical protein BDV96DRAFT_541472 [Lophiotrema nucula]|uniref:Uncharacterized protein n=1 Tax=Lophiotrema nucula TaxID=690887 RepID=A0A6A5ZIG5_9PLEO|nr:hypothetical protein BDV96DRAFT_541472 [Lophiotrema nucula]
MRIVRSAFYLAATLHPRLINAQDDLGVSQGFTTFRTGAISGQLVTSSQNLASLRSAASDFDFLPFDFLAQLASNGAHHIGDVTLRYRTSSNTSWISRDSSSSRGPVAPLVNLEPGVIMGADLAPTLDGNIPLKVTREWLVLGDDLALRFNVTNSASGIVEMGSFGLPISINNIFTNRTAVDTQANCSLADPYIGLQAGYVRVSPLKGTGNALAITPMGSTQFEAWRFLPEPDGNFGYQSQTFEGNYEWQIHSLAWATNEWNNSVPWNSPTSKTLEPGEVYSVGLRFRLTDSVRSIEDAVVASETPLAVGIPGYVVPVDLTASLYLNYSFPVASIDTGGAFTAIELSGPGSVYRLTPTGSIWGRCRVTIRYADGKTQTVHYFIPKSASSTLADMGQFFITAAHFTDASDPFGRAPSIMTYDRQLEKIVTQDPRVWIAGLSDEGGTGAYLATSMKQFAQPDAHELGVVDDFIHDTVVGTIQQNNTFGVVASTFFYQPNATNYTYDASIDWSTWTSWNKARAYTTRRAYNYIHSTATYWALYRNARNYPDIKLRADWSWYLGRAYNTTQYCLSNRAANCDYGLVGLMGETVLGELLEDLKREGLASEAAALESTMRYRARLWDTQAVPYGSEMAWDSTGQEGVYYWTNYFNLTSTATKTINSILGYMPTVAHWGWNGNARRYWDFVYAARITQVERQIHHYGSALNSLPLLSYFEQNPTDLYALRVAFAGNTAPLTNIDEGGFGSAAFHSYPELLKWDPYSGDYGQGFLGLALGQCTYIVNDRIHGDLIFGGNLIEAASNATTVLMEPRDAVRRRVFVADLGLKIEISAGVIQRVAYDKATRGVALDIVPLSAEQSLCVKNIVVWLKRPGHTTVAFGVAGAEKSRGGWLVDFSDGTSTAKITAT